MREKSPASLSIDHKNRVYRYRKVNQLCKSVASTLSFDSLGAVSRLDQKSEVKGHPFYLISKALTQIGILRHHTLHLHASLRYEYSHEQSPMKMTLLKWLSPLIISLILQDYGQAYQLHVRIWRSRV